MCYQWFTFGGTQAKFKCKECGFKANADFVGALNILERGHRLLARKEYENYQAEIEDKIRSGHFLMETSGFKLI